MGYLKLAIAILFNVVGQLLLKRSAMTSGAAISPPAVEALYEPYLSVWFMSGVVFLGLSALLWVRVLTKIPLTVAQPLTGVQFILVPVACNLLWQEPLSPTRIVGILVITAGVALVVKGGS